MASEIEREERKARDSLLRHYSSECVAHGAYILTWFIAFFAFTQSLDKISLPNIWAHYVLIILVLSGLATGVTYSIGKLLYWSFLTSIVLDTPIMGEKQAVEYLAEGLNTPKEKIKESRSFNALFRLSLALDNQMHKSASSPGKFFGTKRLRRTVPVTFLIWLLVFALMTFLYLIMLGQIKVIFN
jgi:hypothetical protein